MGKKSKTFVLCNPEEQNEPILVNSSLENDKEKCIELITQAEIIELDPDSDDISMARAALGVSNKQKDLMYIKFKMVHANTNKNRDRFLEQELAKAEKTPVLKLVNWNHKEPNIGVIYKSKFVEATENEPAYLLCVAAISKYKYPAYAQEILDRYEQGKLFFSMETFFEEAECSVCNEVFSKGEDSYCVHLKNRYAEGSSVARILYGLTFAGTGVVESPADIQAEGLAIASSTEAKTTENAIANNEEAESVFTQEQVNEMIAAAVAELQAKLEAAEASNNEKVTELMVQLGSLTEEKTQLAEAKNTLEASLQTVTDEYNTYKQNVEQEKVAAARLEQLVSLGYEIPNKETEQEKFDSLFAKLKTVNDAAFDLIKELSVKKVVASATADNTATAGTRDEVTDLPLTSVSDTQDPKLERVTAAQQSILDVLRQ